jgi:hypothetical protein
MTGMTCITNTTARWIARLVLFPVAVITGHYAFAIGPDNYGYTAAAITFSFDDLSVAGVPSIDILDRTDDAAITAPIGFPFTFYGVTYTSVSVSTNGILTFGGADTGYKPVDFKASAPPANLPTISPLWHDWTFQYLGSDEAYYATLGSPGSRRFVAQWNFAQSASSNSTDPVTFQVKLFEGSNNIEFHYDDAALDGDNSESSGRGSTVGIRDINGQTTGRNLVWSYDQAVINDSSAIRFTAPGFKIKSIARLSNGTIVLQCTGAPSKPNHIEASLTLGPGSFAPISPSVTGDSSGNFQYTDTSAGGLLRRFYRVGYP